MSKVWVLIIGVLEVNPELDPFRAQRERARSALFSRVLFYNACSLESVRTPYYRSSRRKRIYEPDFRVDCRVYDVCGNTMAENEK